MAPLKGFENERKDKKTSKKSSESADNKKIIKFAIIGLIIFLVFALIGVSLFFFVFNDDEEDTGEEPGIDAPPGVQIVDDNSVPVDNNTNNTNQQNNNSNQQNTNIVDNNQEEEENEAIELPEGVTINGQFTDNYLDNNSILVKTKNDFVSVEKHDFEEEGIVYFLLTIDYRGNKFTKKVSYNTWKVMPLEGIVIAEIEYFIKNNREVITDVRPDKDYQRILEKEETSDNNTNNEE